MSDPTYTADDYLHAERVLAYLSEHRQLEFALENETFDQDKAKQHFGERWALNIARGILLNEGERLLKGL